MKPYIHKVAYYETDKMAITHHSNYIRWMEEARVDFLTQIGWSFKKLEENGIASPVLSVNATYKHTTTFDDSVVIETRVKGISGLRLTISYCMKNLETQTVVFEGESEHCFFNKDGRPIRLEKDFPEFYQALLSAC